MQVVLLLIFFIFSPVNARERHPLENDLSRFSFDSFKKVLSRSKRFTSVINPFSLLRAQPTAYQVIFETEKLKKQNIRALRLMHHHLKQDYKLTKPDNISTYIFPLNQLAHDYNENTIIGFRSRTHRNFNSAKFMDSKRKLSCEAVQSEKIKHKVPEDRIILMAQRTPYIPMGPSFGEPQFWLNRDLDSVFLEFDRDCVQKLKKPMLVIESKNKINGQLIYNHIGLDESLYESW
ncbi:MAG: hypothetical protein HRT47_09080 [Candidatus Caenarcaniphilales bacterium]|nr:hypothetical protein [Candidatus Caenarcaniphilales bacterium]